MSQGAISAGHPLTADAAAECLKAGGNAVDAAVAAAFTACVTEPVLISLGGGGFMMVSMADEEPELIDFFTQTPLRKLPREQADFYAVEVDFGTVRQEFNIGLGSVATPGMVKGLFEAQRRHGKLPMSAVVEYAVTKARQGVEVSRYQANICSLVEPILMADASSRKMFESKIKPGGALGEGDCLRMRRFADLLETMAIEGDDLFYLGEVADEIQSLASSGCEIGKEDLRQYRVEFRHPLEIKYREHLVITNPPPAAGGALIAFALQLLSDNDLTAMQHDDAEHFSLLRESMELTNAARIESTAQGRHHPDQDRLLSSDLLQKYRDQVTTRRHAWRGTTHLSIIDADDNAISLTLSNGEGCGVVLPKAGFMLNNMLGEEDLNPAGFFNWQTGQRMSSMMSPTLVRRPDGSLIATGSGGSNRIRTAILQVLVNLIDLKLPVDVAVCKPRIHAENGLLNIEGGFDSGVAEQLCARYPRHQLWSDINMFFGGTHTVISEKNGMSGCGDPRRGGVFLAV